MELTSEAAICVRGRGEGCVSKSILMLRAHLFVLTRLGSRVGARNRGDSGGSTASLL